MANPTSKKSFTRWAIHKSGTEQLGYLCSFKSEAEDMLRDLKASMPEAKKAQYKVAEVKVEIIEDA